MSTINKEHLDYLKKDFWGDRFFDAKRRNLLTGIIETNL